MKLRQFTIERYRCAEHLELDVDDFMVVVGRNNSGKSTLFHALELFLSSSVRGLDEGTFFNRNVDQPIVLTGRFAELTSAEQDELRPWLVDSVLTLRKEYSLDASRRVSVAYYARTRVPEVPWLHEDFADYNKRTVVTQLPINAFLPSSGHITREVYKQAIAQYMATYPTEIQYQTDWAKNPTGLKQIADKRLPELHLIPALHDVTDETKAGPSGLLGKLVGLVASRMVRYNPVACQQIEQALCQIRDTLEGHASASKLAEIRHLQDSIQNELSPWDVDVNIRVDTPDLHRLLATGTAIDIDDGLPTSIERKGHGLQRSLLFALIRLWALEEKKESVPTSGEAGQRSNIFAFEEPELFLHPHMCRAIYESLKTISSTEQVMLCTHSSQFVHMEDYRNLVIMRRPGKGEGTRATRVRNELFQGDHRDQFNMMGAFNTDHSEIFFARKVALVEGLTEKAVLPIIARRLKVFDHSVSIISCGGKGNLTLYMKVLNAFEIPYIVLYDKDGSGKSASAENKRIETVCDRRYGTTRIVTNKLEDILQIPRKLSEKMGKPYAAVTHYSNPDIEITSSVAGLVEQVYSKASAQNLETSGATHTTRKSA